MTWYSRLLRAALLSLVCIGAACSGSTNNVGGSSDEEEDLGVAIDGSCNIRSDCRSGLLCADDGTCQLAGDSDEGASCNLSGECSAGLFCDALAGGTCVQGGENPLNTTCTSTSDCEAGLVCTPRGFSGVCSTAGEGDLGASCETSQDCFAGLGCVSGAESGEKVCQGGLAAIPQLWPGVQCESDGGDAIDMPLRPYFEVSNPKEFYRMPFPNDIRLTNGHPDMTGHPTPGDALLGFDIVQTYLDTIQEKQDHFGLNQGVLFRFSGRVDLGSIKAGTDDRNLLLINIDPESTEYKRRQSLYWQAATLGSQYICPNWMMVRPAWGSPLRPRTTYAAIVLNSGIAGENGDAMVRDSDFEAVMGSADPGGELSAAWNTYAPLRAWLADDAEVPADEVIVASVFTTGDPMSISRTLREATRGGDAPAASALTLCEDGVTSPCDDGLEGDDHKRGCMGAASGYAEIHGKISLPILQKGDAPYESVGGGLELAGGVPRVQRSEEVCMAMTVPDSTMPEAGWPVVIYAHGTGGSYRSHVGQLSASLSNVTVGSEPVGFLVLGWDQVQHFTRRGDSELDPEGLVYNFLNPDAAQGNFYQGAADIHALVRWLETLEVSAEDSPTGVAIKADPNQVYFIGHSQGGQSGPLALPFEPGIRGAVLSGSGAGLTLSLLGKTSPVNIPQAVSFALQDTRVDEAHPVLNLIQGYFDPVDPLIYAEYLATNVIEGVTTPMHVFHTIGLEDTYTPPSTLAIMATSMRITGINPPEDPELPRLFIAQEDPPIGGNVGIDGERYTAVGRQYSPDGYDGHFVLFRNAKAQNDLAEFLSSAVLGDFPEIKD